MANSLEQIQQNFANLSLTKKIVLFLIIGGTISGIVVLLMWLQVADFQLLYSNLSYEDAGKIIEKLKEQKTPYKISGDGTSIMVPVERVRELRIQLATDGLPQGGGVGFEIFDKTSIGMSDFIQKLNYKRALQGEMARTISQLSEVEQARVHLVIPERRLFRDNQEQARASIVLKLRPLKRLLPNQVQGIVHLVASSVEDLSPQNITIIDTNGNILSLTSDDSMDARLTNSQLEHQRNVDKNFEKKIQSMLERVVGKDKAVVRVSSTIDYKRVERTEETFDPDIQVPRSEQRTQEKSSGKNITPVGVPGVISNIPEGDIGGEANETRETSSQTQKQNETVNYEIGKTISHIIEPTGTIMRLSVAVLVDGTYDLVKGEDGKETKKYIPRTNEELAKFEKIVKNTIGYNEERGDQVEVVNISFENSNLLDGTEEKFPSNIREEIALWFPVVIPVMKYIVIIILIFIVFFFVINPLLKNMLTVPEQPIPVHQELSQAIEQQIENIPEIQEKKEVLQIAKQNPKNAAIMIKKWLKEK
ncbi:MAG: flagellar basal-body MS-ring/collar protein FliF [Nitrospirota bacterium]